MKTCIKNPFLLPVLIAGMGLMLAGRVTAQTFTTLHSFPATAFSSEGAGPKGGLVLSGSTLYGTTADGGSSGGGTVFAVNTDGTGFTNLYTFTAGSGSYSSPGSFASITNSDGAFPLGTFTLLGDTLYGTTFSGGSSGNGTVFAVNTDGTGFTNVYTFTATSNYTNSDGAQPYAGLILTGKTLYGTARNGGTSGVGTVFKVNTDGTAFKNLHNFTAIDGAQPEAGLIVSGNTLYGTAVGGGSSGNGTVFALDTDGTGFRNLFNFTCEDGGLIPTASLILSGNTVYGKTEGALDIGCTGMVFKVNTNATGFTNLHAFGNYDSGIDSCGDLILSGNTLYGTAAGGGSSGNGTVFALNTDGTGFRNLYSFSTVTTNSSLGNYTNSDGAWPRTGLILSGNTLYGTTSYGGALGNGTVFSLSLPVPQLTILPSGSSVILSWLTNYAGFDYSGLTLQSTTNLSSPVWTTNLPPPVVINGQYTITNPISGTQQFFRLSQ